ncbi:MAG TPA: hypothetical protein VGF49_18375, partial [Candidatus Solibacter sp.]
MMRGSRLGRICAVAAVAFALGTPAEAYYHYVHFTSTGAPFTPQQEKFRIAVGGTVNFFVSDQGPA